MEEKRKKIFEQFITNDKLTFAEIEKETSIRSNLLAYYLKLLQNEDMLTKKGNYYLLTKKAEKYIPIYSNRSDELLPVSVVLVAILNKNKILLINRNKRPYKNKWSLVASKIYFEEKIPQVAINCVTRRTKLNGDFQKISCVFQEHVVEPGLVKQSLIHYFCTVNVDCEKVYNSEFGKLEWFDVNNLPDNLIQSDKWLIQNKLDSKIDVYYSKINENKKDFEMTKL